MTGGSEGTRKRQPPLIAAAAAGHAAMVRLLLERGADPNIQDSDRQTAEDVAKREAFVDVLGELARVIFKKIEWSVRGCCWTSQERGGHRIALECAPCASNAR